MALRRAYRRGPSRSRPLVRLHRPLPCHTMPYHTTPSPRSRLLTAHDLTSCLSVRTLTATGAPSQTSTTMPCHSDRLGWSAVWPQALLCTEFVNHCMTLRLHAIICPRTVSSRATVERLWPNACGFACSTDKMLLLREGGGWRNSPHARVRRGGSAWREGQRAFAFAWQDRQVLFQTMRVN